MESLKVSSYVHEYEMDGNVFVLSNYLWRTFLQLDPEEAQLFRQVRERKESLIGLPESLRVRLHEQKMLIDAGLNEAQFITQKYDNNRFTDEILGLTIAPTIDCNFACLYCYEDKRPGRMTPETEAAVIDYVRRQLPGRKRLIVTWYGGEPLLCKETVYRLTEAFLEIAESLGCKYESFMVTNGYLLAPDVADRLAGYGHWRNVQFTLDGHAETHDQKRPTRGGKGTFDGIWKNLLYAASKLPMTLRMNVDLLNPEGCHNLLDQLAEAGLSSSGLRVYFAPIHPFGKGCRDISEKEGVDVGDNTQFADTEVDLVKHALELGFKSRFRMQGPWLTQCQAVSTHSVVVEPDGSLQRCWVEVGENNKRVGHITQPLEFDSSNNMRWMRFDPTRNDPCRSCEVLPLCFGACPHRHVDGAPEEFTCNEIRYNVKEMVLLEYVAKHLGNTSLNFGKPRVDGKPLEMPASRVGAKASAGCGSCGSGARPAAKEKLVQLAPAPH